MAAPWAAPTENLQPPTLESRIPTSANFKLIEKELHDNIQEIESFVNGEHHDKSKLIFEAHQNALSKLVNNNTIPHGKNILERIKLEYDSFVNVLEKGKYQVTFLEDRANKMRESDDTHKNLVTRKEEISNKLKLIKSKKNILKQNIKNLRNELHPPIDYSLPVPPKTLKTSENLHHFLRLSRKENASKFFNKEDLTQNVSQLEKEITEFDNKQTENYCKKSTIADINNKIIAKDKKLCTIEDSNDLMWKEICQKHIKAQINLKNENNLRISNGDCEKRKLEDSRKENSEVNATHNDVEIVATINTFYNLIRDGDVKEAAKFASSCNNGIMRNKITMDIFKHMPHESENLQQLFCDALMDNCALYDDITVDVGDEIITCCAKQKAFDSLLLWTSKKQLNYSLEGVKNVEGYCFCRMPCSCYATEVAQTMYNQKCAYTKAVCCDLKLGNYKSAITYCKEKMFTETEYINVIMNQPVSNFINELLNNQIIDQVLPFNKLIKILTTNPESNQRAITFLNYVLETRGANVLSNFIYKERHADGMSQQLWYQLIDCCQASSHHELAEELLSIIETRKALDNAMYMNLLDYIS